MIHTAWLIAPSRLDGLLAAVRGASVGGGPAERPWALPLPAPFQRHVLAVTPPCGLPCRDVRGGGMVTCCATHGASQVPNVYTRYCARPQVPLTPLLSRLDVEPLLMLYSALLCERRVVMVSRSAAVASSCAYAAVALLQPFEWMVGCHWEAQCHMWCGSHAHAPSFCLRPTPACVHSVCAEVYAAVLLRACPIDRRGGGR